MRTVIGNSKFSPKAQLANTASTVHLSNIVISIKSNLIAVPVSHATISLTKHRIRARDDGMGRTADFSAPRSEMTVPAVLGFEPITNSKTRNAG